MESLMPRGHSARTRRSVQLVAGLGSCIAPFLVASMVVAAPVIGEDLGAEVAQLAWLTAAFFLVSASLLIPIGRIADMRGSKKVFTAGMAVYLLSNLACALAPDMNLLIICRGLTGAGAAMVFGTSISLISLVFPEKERGRAIGLNVTSMFAGFTIGLLVSGLLTYYLSWRYTFLIAALIAGLNICLLRMRVRGECELTRSMEIDLPSMALLSLSMMLLFYGLPEIVHPAGQLSFIAGGFTLGLLALRQRKAPLIFGAGITSNRSFRLSILTNILFQAGAFTVPFLLSLYYQFINGLDARTAAIALLLPQILMSVTGAVGGRLAARAGDRRITTTGALVNALGVSILLTLTQGTPFTLTLLSLALVGIGTGLFMPALMNWAVGSISREDYGVGSSITETARLTGMTLSNVIVILAFTLMLGGSSVGQGDEDLFVESVRLCALAYLFLSLLSIAPSMTLKKGKAV